MKRSLFSLALLGFAFPASASQVYLDCSVQYPGDPPRHFMATVDDATGKVSHRDDNGRTFVADGVFTPETVAYELDPPCALTCARIKYEINRIDLSAHASIEIYARDLPNTGTVESDGQCTLQAAPAERKF